MAKSSRKGPGSAKHLASSSSPERLTNSDAGMIAQAPCVQQPINGPLTHHSRSPVQRLPAPLPLNTPKSEKSLVHYDAGQMPVLTDEGKTVRVIAGSILGASSPVKTSSSMFYADVAPQAGAAVPLDPAYEERAIYTVSGAIEIAGDVFEPAQLLVFRPG